MKEHVYCRCLYFSANALARAMTRIAEEEYAAVGLAPSYAFVLMTVNKQPGITAGEVAEIMLLDPSTVTRLVEKLEKQGYLRRHSEGKYTHIYPLAPALALDAPIREAWKNIYERYTAIIGQEKGLDLAVELFQVAQQLEP